MCGTFTSVAENVIQVDIRSLHPTQMQDVSGSTCKVGCLIAVLPLKIETEPPSHTHKYMPMTIPLQDAVLYQAGRQYIALKDVSTTLWIRPNLYCLPNQKHSESSEYFIQSFKLGTIQNHSDGNNGYESYTLDHTQQTDLQKGRTYPLSISPNMSPAHRQFAQVWIDLDQSETFEANELLYSASIEAGKNIFDGKIKIPTDAIKGETLMRVVMKRDSAPTDACESFKDGEVEDYLVNITRGVRKDAERMLQATISPNPSSGMLTLQWQNTEATPTQIRVYNISGKLAYTQTINPTEDTELRLNLDLSHLNKGLYIVEVQTADTQYKSKLFLTE